MDQANKQKSHVESMKTVVVCFSIAARQNITGIENEARVLLTILYRVGLRTEVDQFPSGRG